MIVASIILQVKIIKCLVENIVVDISFDQLGGLCTLCFLEEVKYFTPGQRFQIYFCDFLSAPLAFSQLLLMSALTFKVDQLIDQNHLFKRSIILIKAWCYYESRILGAHHGLISTYALETLVLYIFHVFNNKFAGPLEVTLLFLLNFSFPKPLLFLPENLVIVSAGALPLSGIFQ
jgi:hypothetical protein